MMVIEVKSMNLTKSLVFFGFPGFFIYINFQFVYQFLMKLDVSEFWATFLCLWVPVILVIVLVIFLWKKSGERFNDYFWINILSLPEILLVLGAFVFVQIGELLLGPTRAYFSQMGFFQIPEVFPSLFSPHFEPVIPLETFMGMNTKENYIILVLWAVWLVVNILGEEFLWRGYALPRMEKHFGKYAWILNGLLWNIFIHFFMRYSFLAFLPVSLVVPYLSQKYKSWVPGVIIHGLGNALVYIILIPSVIR